MSHSTFILLASVALAGGTGAGVAAWVDAQDAVAVPVGSSSEPDARLDGILDRLDSLERIKVVEPARAESIGLSRTAVVDAGRDAVERRLAVLEEALVRIEASLGARVGSQRAGDAQSRQPVHSSPRPLTVAEGQRAIIDPSASERDKLEAWKSLRFKADAYTDEVVASMVVVGLNAVDPEVRASVWRNADSRTKHDALVPALLQALQMDPTDAVREEAAETLVEYVDRPHVLATIQHMIATETHKGVRSYLEDAVKRSGR